MAEGSGRRFERKIRRDWLKEHGAQRPPLFSVKLRVMERDFADGTNHETRKMMRSLGHRPRYLAMNRRTKKATWTF